jgi:hypothetical protein
MIISLFMDKTPQSCGRAPHHRARAHARPTRRDDGRWQQHERDEQDEDHATRCS